MQTNLVERPMEETSDVLAKSSQWLTFQQFKNINCNILGYYGPNGCWENQGAGTNLNYTNSYNYYSLFHVYGTTGSPMSVVGEIDGFGVIAPNTCPIDWVCGYWMETAWVWYRQCHPDAWHKYKVFHPSDTRMHMALNTLNNAPCLW